LQRQKSYLPPFPAAAPHADPIPAPPEGGSRLTEVLMAIVTLRYWAAAKEAAGIAEETITAGTLAEALAAARGRAGQGADSGQDVQDGPDGRGTRDARLRAVLARSSFLVDGMPVGTRAPDAVVLSDGAVIEVLPPFAGG
jgi:molybdopterin synthase sulfur carrier subunit